MNILLQYIHLKATQVAVIICSHFSWIHFQLNLMRCQTWSKFDFLLLSLSKYLTERWHITLSCGHKYSSTVYTPKGHSGYGPNMQQFQLNPLPVKFGEASNVVKIWLFAPFIERRPNRTETFYAIFWCMNILLQYIHLKATEVTVIICSNCSWIHCQWNLVRRQTWSKCDFLLTKA